MKKIPNRIIWGGLLILLGTAFLLQQLNIIGSPLETTILVLMAAAGVVFLVTYFQSSDSWWAVIPGLALIGIALTGLNDQFNFLPGGGWEGGLFLGLLGLAFWLVYFRGQADWWAIIPGGVLVTLAVVAGVDELISWGGTLFFFGLSATFALVAVLPGGNDDTRWALIPAGVLAVLGLIQVPGLQEAANLVWPGALILIGLYLIVRNWL